MPSSDALSSIGLRDVVTGRSVVSGGSMHSRVGGGLRDGQCGSL